MTLAFIHELAEWNESAPEDVAVLTPTGSATVRVLNGRVAALVRTLRARKFPPRELVAVSADGIDEIVGLLAVCVAGGIPVVTPSFDEFTAAGARFCVTRDRDWAPASAIAITDGSNSGPLDLSHVGDAVALLTSGTTGRPKLALLTADRIEARLQGYFEWWPTENFATLFRPSAVSGLFTLIAAIRARHPMAFFPVIDRAAVELCGSEKIRHIYGSPHQIVSLIDVAEGGGVPLSFDVVSTAGAPQTAAFVTAVRRVCQGQIRSVYGSTEAGGIALSEQPTDAGFRGRIGRGAEVTIVDEGGNEVAPNTEGIVRYRAPGLVDNYLVDGQLRAVTSDGWFYPGDVGSTNNDGELTIHRRDGDIVNIGGAKVNPLEFESRAESIDGVKDAGCAAVTFPDGSNHLVLAVITRDETAYAAVVASFGALPETNRPNVVVSVPSIPRNRNGKLMRDELADRLTRAIRVTPAP